VTIELAQTGPDRATDCGLHARRVARSEFEFSAHRVHATCPCQAKKGSAPVDFPQSSLRDLRLSLSPCPPLRCAPCRANYGRRSAAEIPSSGDAQRLPTAKAAILASRFSRDSSPALSPSRKAKSPVGASSYFAAGSYLTAQARLPSVSRNLTTQPTPRMAALGITILPPFASTARATASTSSTTIEHSKP
jgi:hypothetical protein